MKIYDKSFRSHPFHSTWYMQNLINIQMLMFTGHKKSIKIWDFMITASREYAQPATGAVEYSELQLTIFQDFVHDIKVLSLNFSLIFRSYPGKAV